jgi:tRNA(Ile)-lysidine synthase
MNAVVHDLDALVAAALPEDGVAVLAVSGGLDSMVLLDVAGSMHTAGWSGDIIVATFDHSSGPHSRRAVAHVTKRALAHGLTVVSARAPRGLRTEADWRASRWDFLRGVAAGVNGVVLTAHTRDDQIETVLMRMLRGSGARGLAGLFAESGVRRPFVDVSRAELQVYASVRRLKWLEDPTNQSRRFLRNRVRLDHLPALRRVSAGIDEELLRIARSAADWRRELGALIDSAVPHRVSADAANRATLDVAVEILAGYSREALGVLWPELASRAGVTLDRRGTRRAAEFTMSGRTGQRIQLSGGWQLVRGRELLELRPLEGATGQAVEPVYMQEPLTAHTIWSRWTFRASGSGDVNGADEWSAALPANRPLFVRCWQPGDRMHVRSGEERVARKVKSLLTDAGVSGHIRRQWPVVLAGEETVWIPGVRRSDAATERSGWPVVTYVCDYLDRRP